VSAAANQPPPDIDALEARRGAALAERDTAIIERDAALRQNDRLAHLLRQLQRMQFGRRSEKLDPDQFALALEEIEQAEVAREAADDKQNKATATTRVEKRRASRGALPAHLPRVHLTIEPADRNCPCCRSPMHAISADVSERLDVVPAQFRVLVTHRPKYACRLRGGRGSGAGARAADQGRPTDRDDGRLRAGVQIRLASAALSSGPDAGRLGPRHQALDAGFLGWLRGRRTPAGL
jgi:transposase